MTTTKRSELSLKLGLAVAAAAVAALGAAGCAPDQAPPSLIETTRVLGARLEVTGAPERATPKPGESVTVSWLMAAPGDMPPLGWAFVLCPGTAGSLDCGGEPLALMQGHDLPRLSIDVPAADALGGTKLLVLEGRVCAGSEPVLDPAGGARPKCADGAQGTTASVAIPIDLDTAGSEANTNPSLAGSPVTLDGQPWETTASAAAAACADLPHVTAATKEHVLAVGTVAADRETYTALMGDPPVAVERRETLQVSQFTTSGELARAFTWIEADDTSAAPAAEVKWDAPEAKDVPAEGKVVKFTFVARDGRGGVDWTARALCVTP